MALNNIISPRQSVVNSQGQPVAGGSVFLYEPGTTTFITSYFGANLVTPHQNPVRLSGSGRADIWVTLDCDMVILDRNGNTVLTQDNANPASLGGTTSSLVPNGSFELVTTPPVPDGWSALNDAGSTNAVDSTQSTDGLNSYRFTSAGAGGGSLTTTDFFPVNDVDQLRVNFNLFSDVAAVLNIVRVEWFDVTFVSISDSDVYSSTANPPTWTEFQLVATPPPNARFAKLKLIGIDPSVLLAGNTYYDQIAVFYPTVVSGIFDNITIQDNEIITTNLNGELNLLPNGLGPVNAFSAGAVDLADIQNTLNLGNVFGPTLNPHLAFDAATIQAKTDATTAALALSIQPLGGIVTLGAAAVTRLATAPGGVVGLLSDGNTDAEARLLVLTHQAGTARAQIGQAGTATLGVHNLIDTGHLQLIARNTGSLDRILVEGDPDGEVNIFDPVGDVVRLATQAGGDVSLRSDANTDAEQRRLRFDHQDGTLRGFVGMTSDLTMRVNSIAGAVDLAHVNVNVARTTTAAAGGLTANNLATAAGFERVLTVSDLGSVGYPLIPQDNEEIQFGNTAGGDIQMFFNGSVQRYDGDFDHEFDSNAANDHSIKLLNTVAGLGIRIGSDGIAHLSELFNTGGFVGDYIDMDDADGRVYLNYGNVPVARTAPVSGAAYPYIDTTGGFLVNNNTTGTGNNERVTTYTDHMMTGGLQDDRNLDGPTPVADNRLVNGATCRVGYWKFEVFATFRDVGGTSNINFDFGGSNITQCRYKYDFETADGAPVGAGASDDAGTDQLVTLGAGLEETMLRISGQVQFSASSTFQFRWAPTVNQIDTVSRMSGGWMTLCPIEIL